MLICFENKVNKKLFLDLGKEFQSMFMYDRIKQKKGIWSDREMQDRYAGDIGDYGKFGLLTELQEQFSTFHRPGQERGDPAPRTTPNCCLYSRSRVVQFPLRN